MPGIKFIGLVLVLAVYLEQVLQGSGVLDPIQKAPQQGVGDAAGQQVTFQVPNTVTPYM